MDKLDKMEEKYSKRLDKELKEVGKSVIDDWYSDFIPNSYHRINSLYKAFKVTVRDGHFSVDFSARYMLAYHHRVKNSYIFQNSFMEGWHGGANDGPDHPFPGIPMYREPAPYYTLWSYVAEHSDPPYEAMVKKMNYVISEISDDYDKEFMSEIYNKISAKLKMLKGGT